METDFASMEQSDDRVNRQKLISDLKVVVHDAEELMKATATDLGERAREARVKLAATLESAKASCKKLEEKTLATAKAADRVIRDHPYHSVGVAFGVGLLVGVLVNRR
jgi:ElaB/YqjD/DUF883 family membrane-anchored ribosome-binding protein